MEALVNKANVIWVKIISSIYGVEEGLSSPIKANSLCYRMIKVFTKLNELGLVTLNSIHKKIVLEMRLCYGNILGAMIFV
ncbi:hypothetical protein HanPSC8_Chr05g0195651 [Helianthus annuus]|nr:hypothetical protein HanPSC8_Chr05g0195651 [Helianthus annuus]